MSTVAGATWSKEETMKLTEVWGKKLFSVISRDYHDVFLWPLYILVAILLLRWNDTESVSTANTKLCQSIVDFGDRHNTEVNFM